MGTAATTTAAKAQRMRRCDDIGTLLILFPDPVLGSRARPVSSAALGNAPARHSEHRHASEPRAMRHKAHRPCRPRALHQIARDGRHNAITLALVYISKLRYT